MKLNENTYAVKDPVKVSAKVIGFDEQEKSCFIEFTALRKRDDNWVMIGEPVTHAFIKNVEESKVTEVCESMLDSIYEDICKIIKVYDRNEDLDTKTAVQ